MARKKSYGDYRASSNVKFPFVAWVLDKKPFYAAFLILALVVGGSFVNIGWNSYKNAASEPEEVSPYMELASQNSPGRSWAASLIAKTPEGISTWSVSEKTRPQSVIDSKLCPVSENIATSLLSTHTGTGDGVQTRVQVYGAGQAFKEFENYANLLNPCFGGVNIESMSKSHVAMFANGFILTSGDAVIGVTSPSNEMRDSLLDFYINEAEASLTETECLALSSSSSESKRSFFYNKEEYTGLQETKELSSTVNISELPTPTELTLLEVETPDAVIPEAPLPSDFPELPKEMISKPTIPAPLKDETGFTDNAAFKIADVNGPGCGWKWSGQEAPVYDDAQLEEEKSSAIKATQNLVNSRAVDYVKGKINWARQIAFLSPRADEWNSYVNRTNAVHDKWEWLEVEREKIKTDWYNYVEAHDSWFTFDDRKAAALTEFEAATKKCEDDKKALEEWEDKYGDMEEPKPSPSPSPSAKPSPSATPTPSPTSTVKIPEKPAGCDTLPERPEILDLDKPAEPKAPYLPVGVTIPQSWPTAKTN